MKKNISGDKKWVSNLDQRLKSFGINLNDSEKVENLYNSIAKPKF